MHTQIQILPVTGIGDIRPGDDLGSLIYDALKQQQLTLQQGDVLIITQKIVSKAEGRLVHLDDIEPSPFALQYAQRYQKDAQHVEVVLRESKRIVRMDHGVMICESHHGFICANAGVDESNIGGERVLALLPEDSDRSAHQVRQRMQELTGEGEHLDFAVIISDTWGRPWRNGQVNMAIGVAGMEPVTDYRGQNDPYGYELRASMIGVADELAAAAELVMGKVDRIPVALIRGYTYKTGQGSGRDLIRESATDMFR
ncbi:coenzyme F420-0:L-glutamate ligase [Ktedonobacter racemifer]|uniref:F420-dependent oxidoreductase n=1 Tax=Ktedonobacter racemifer DSM 44963 TaxID=485913 RepID=D6U5X6_KTERA|nr:coenzyme F420-0:L-glutamate ligase [Ktedonobacter racemifer]EFH80387.1 F420-dependent oxidoreductase [Ktedonobacter racemifer DSM 44963]